MIKIFQIFSIIGIVCTSNVSGITSFTISSIKVNDSGNSNPTLTIPAQAYDNSTVETDGDLNLIEFVVDDGMGMTTAYTTSSYVSGIGSDTVVDHTQLDAVIQPNGFATPAAGTNVPFYTGSQSNLAPYLISGERGLSFSAALNYKSNDDPAVLIIPMEFKSSPFNSSRPTFLVGDGADNQSADLWEFLDNDNNVIASFTTSSSDFNRFGDQNIDRVTTSGNANPNLGNGFLSGGNGNGDSLGLGLSAFSLEASDFSGDWEDVVNLRLKIPGVGSSPKTDYAFIGVDYDIIESDNLVVPEPQVFFLTVLSGIGVLVKRRRI